MGISGPPPKDPETRARRNPSLAMTKLPAAGRQGTAPRWPLPADVTLTATLKVARTRAKDLKVLAEAEGITARERATRDRQHAAAAEKVAMLEAMARSVRKRETSLWAELWATPMAVQWEKLRWTHEVALYVRFQSKGELGDAKAAQEARLRAESLGLTPTALQKLRWRVEELPQAAAAGRPGPVSGSRSRYGHVVAFPGGESATG